MALKDNKDLIRTVFEKRLRFTYSNNDSEFEIDSLVDEVMKNEKSLAFQNVELDLDFIDSLVKSSSSIYESAVKLKVSSQALSSSLASIPVAGAAVSSGMSLAFANILSFQKSLIQSSIDSIENKAKILFIDDDIRIKSLINDLKGKLSSL